MTSSMTPEIDTFAARLQRARTEQHIAKTDLYVKARLCRGPARSVNTRIIAALEAGTVPRLDAVHKLAQALGVHPVWLAFGEDPKLPGWLADASLEGLALRLRTARELAQLSQVELAAQIGLRQPAVSLCEQGRKYLFLDQLLRCAEVLKVKPSWLAFCVGPMKDVM